MPSDRPRPQVRRRAPSTGRPATRSTPRRTVSSRPTRRSTRGVRRSNQLPLAVRLLFVVAIAALGIVSFATATGGLSQLVGGLGGALGSSLGSAAAGLAGSSGSPSPVPSGELGIPALTEPVQPYTNQTTVEVSGQLPAVAVGAEGYRVRLYVTLKDAEPVKVAEIPVPTTAVFTIPGVPLQRGENLFTATIVDPAGTESEPSQPIRYVQDTLAPKVTIASPKDGATVDTPTTEIAGKTQPKSTLAVRNDANGQTIPGTAGPDGTYRVSIPLEPGRNEITVTATDPSGNAGAATVVIVRTGESITASLTASAYRFPADRLPASLVLTATATDPSGTPIVGAKVTFSVSIPGVPVITGEAVTDASGTAVFVTTVPKGAAQGSGPATAFIATDAGSASARTVITIE